MAFVRLFSYGSNSPQQLAGRLQIDIANGKFGFQAARCPDHELCFAGPSMGWSPDGRPVATATLRPCRGRMALGSIVTIPESMLAQLDRFEGVPRIYQRTRITVQHDLGVGWEDVNAVVYLRLSSEAMMPSEAYLLAVWRHLVSFHPDMSSIDVKDTQGALIQTWKRQPFSSLSLDAQLFEIGYRKMNPWSMPLLIRKKKQKLKELFGISDAAGFLQLVPKKSKFLKVFDAEDVTIVESFLSYDSDDDEPVVSVPQTTNIGMRRPHTRLETALRRPQKGSETALRRPQKGSETVLRRPQKRFETFLRRPQKRLEMVVKKALWRRPRKGWDSAAAP